MDILGIPFITLLDQNAGVALVLIGAAMIWGLWRLERRLASVEGQWSIFNAARVAESTALRDAVDLLREDMTRIHGRLDRQDMAIDRLERLCLREAGNR